ncbi:MAG: O-antigen ligase family protein [Tepidisphaeraceae bacterium]|jgi:tetratricopeptide (TPR) repeat protein
MTIGSSIQSRQRWRVDWYAGLTRGAFLLVLAVAVARCTFLESLRDPFPVSPGTAAYPRGPGPAWSLALDLICGLSVLLVLLRRVVDRSYVLRWGAAQILLLPLAAWTALSVKWADDKFAAMVGAAHLVAALALLWSASQLVRSWLRLRIVAAVAYGLLLVFLAQGFYYKFAELPETARTFLANKPSILRDRGYVADSFVARQFEKKILSGELLGFTSSANSLASLIVLLTVIGAAVAMQRRVDRDPPAWAGGLALAVPLAVWLLIYTRSKAAMVLPILAAAMLLVIWRFGRSLANHWGRWFWATVAAVGAAMAAVVGYGLVRHGLPTASLNFRWRYWVAAWHILLRHPIRGVGWDNFGQHYLGARLPAAAEEVRDPHDFLVRFFVELGVIGGVLLLAWIIRLWWELSRPITPPPPADRTSHAARAGGFAQVLTLVLVILAINIFADIDFHQDASFIALELMKRIMYLAALVIGASLVALRSLEGPRLDDRPAPWILYGLLVGIGVFLIHNLIEFSIFEAGPLCLFGLLAGSALGARLPTLPTAWRRTAAAVCLIGGAAIWIAAAIFVWLPTARAEAAAHAGDDALRAGRFDAAAGAYDAARSDLPLNADYAYRAGRALHYGLNSLIGSGRLAGVPQQLRTQIMAYYGSAIGRNPSNVTSYLARASLALETGDRDQVIRDFDKALQLNPNEVSIRLDYARALGMLGLRDKARSQLQFALHYNDLLDKSEPKRLPPDQVRAIQKQIASLKD